MFLAVQRSVARTRGFGLGVIIGEPTGISAKLWTFNSKGFRVLGVAYRKMGSESRISKDHQAGVTISGFLVHFDPPKLNIIETVTGHKNLGVVLKIITGDNRLVDAHVSQEMRLSDTRTLTGRHLSQLSDAALLKRVEDVDVFAEIEPNQKERIILALRKAGNVVGYMGDGMNDASALHVLRFLDSTRCQCDSFCSSESSY